MDPLSVADELILDTGAAKSIIYTSVCTAHKHLVNIPMYREGADDTCSAFRVREETPSARKSVKKPPVRKTDPSL